MSSGPDQELPPLSAEPASLPPSRFGKPALIIAGLGIVTRAMTALMEPG